MELQTTVQAIPPAVAPGFDVALNVSITPSESDALLLLLQVFGPSMTKVYETTLDDVVVSEGVPKLVAIPWSLPAGLAAGTYTVSLGVFKAHWAAQYQWYAGITSFTVSTSTASFTSTATVAPSVALPGGTVHVDVVVTSSSTTAAIVDIDLVGADGTSTWPRSFPAELAAGVPLHLVGDWEVPTTAVTGTYRVRVRIYDPGRTQTLHVDDAAGEIKVRSEHGPPAIKVRLKTNQSGDTTYQPSPDFEISNTSEDPIALAELTVRYYFTIDAETALTIGYWTMSIDKAKVPLSIVKMPIPSAVADHYIEIGFTSDAGTLLPGATVGVNTWLHRQPWGEPFDQTDDHSFVAATELVDASTATAYLSGVRVWGTEPPLLDLPPFPTPITATPADTEITLAWAPVAGASGYDVRADGATIEGVTATTCSDAWLSPGTRHTYRVRTRRDDELSVWSAPLTVKTTGGPALPAPVDVRATPTASTITLGWRAPWEAVTGYDVEVDGVVVDAGSSPSYVHGGLEAGELHHYRVRARNGATLGEWSERVRANTIRVPTGPFGVSIVVDTSVDRAPISPYVYGTNADVSGVERWTVRRMGGNRLSTYNWVNNASNGGSDYFQTSDGYVPWYYGGIPQSESHRYDEPGAAAIGFHEQSLAIGAQSLVTLATAGYAARDRNGVVSAAEAAPSARWVAVEPAKPAPFTLTPDPSATTIYMDEFVNFLVHRLGDASTPTGILGYEIDNEPGLWRQTHPLMHPAPTGSAEVLGKSVALAKAVKAVDPHAQLFGPVSYGFNEYYDMQSSSDWSDVKGHYEWYVDYYLDRLRIESAKHGRRLLDVLDLHWYPEIKVAGNNLPLAPSSNDEANRLRVQAPRSLWDPSYVEPSWIASSHLGFLPMIPRLRRSIATYNAGTRLAFTEYSFGGEDHVSGGIAVADVLGVFGRHGVYLATFWKLLGDAWPQASYAAAAFRIFNEYDGTEARYGDVAVRAETSDIDNSSVYGAVHQGDDGRLHLIVINKSFDHDMTASIQLAGGTSYGSARVWAFDHQGPAIIERTPVTAIEGNAFTYAVPKLTVCHFVLTVAAG